MKEKINSTKQVYKCKFLRRIDLYPASFGIFCSVNSGETNFPLARLGFRQTAGATFSGNFFRHGLLAHKIMRKKTARCYGTLRYIQGCQMFIGTTYQNGKK
jgi:hypothetical protein